MPDYSNSIIYKLCCKDTSITDIYVGSTTAFRARKNQHKHRYCNENHKKHNYKVYQFIRDNGGWDNWEMIPIKSVNVNNKTELIIEERKVFEELKPTLNHNIPTRTHKEYYESNKEKIAEYNSEYRTINKEKLAQSKREYYENNKEQIAQIRKRYREKNKEKLAQYQREYRARKKLIDPQ